MEETVFKPDDKERDIVFSHAVKAGKRIYYLDVRKTRGGDHYLSITESKKIAGSETPYGRAQFEKHKIFLYREDFSNFIDGLTRTMRYIHETQPMPAETTKSNDSLKASDTIPAHVTVEDTQDSADIDFKIEF